LFSVSDASDEEVEADDDDEGARAAGWCSEAGHAQVKVKVNK
jgi:hypothetical protein